MKGLLHTLPAPPAEKKGWPWTEEVDPNIYSSDVNWPKISIVTPTFNQGDFIEETIRSVLLQNYPNLEYIIIDGGSTDNTVEIIKQYEAHISYWVSEKDDGQTYAINKGIEKCTGELFNWINSDDYYLKDALFHIGKNYSADTDIVCAICNNVNEEGKLINQKGSRLDADFFQSMGNLPFILHQPSTFFKSSIIQEFPMSPNLHYTMDLETWMMYLLKYGQKKVAYTDEAIINFRIHDSSKSGQEDAFTYFRNDIFVTYQALAKAAGLNELVTTLGNFIERPFEYQFQLDASLLDSKKIEKVIHYFLYNRALYYYHAGDFQQAASYFEVCNPAFLGEKEQKKFRFYRSLGKRFPRSLRLFRKLRS